MPDEQDTSEAAKQIIGVETEWARLNRELSRARQRLSDLEAKTFRAEIAANSEEGGYAAQIMVLDPAFAPTAPSTPPRSMLALAGLAASFFAGLALAAARGIVLDDRVFDAEDIVFVRQGAGGQLAPFPRHEAEQRFAEIRAIDNEFNPNTGRTKTRIELENGDIVESDGSNTRITKAGNLPDQNVAPLNPHAPADDARV